MPFYKGHPWGFKKGYTPWNKGIKASEDARVAAIAKNLNKVSWNKGKKLGPLSEEHRRKIGRKGPLHWNWKGGKETENVRIRRTIDYKLWREAVFMRDNWTCILCGVVQGWDKEKKEHIDIQADHIKSFSKYPKLRLDVNNGRTLCFSCHIKTETWGNNQYLLR